MRGATRWRWFPADFGDGHLDLIVADQGDPTTGIRPGTLRVPGRRTGPVPAREHDPSCLRAVRAGGGRLSVTAISTWPSPNSDTERRHHPPGNGHGTFQFQAPMSYAVGSLPRRHRGLLAPRQRSPRPGDRQREHQRRLGPPGQRRRHFPASDPVRSRLISRVARGGRLQRRRSPRPGRRQPGFQ